MVADGRSLRVADAFAALDVVGRTAFSVAPGGDGPHLPAAAGAASTQTLMLRAPEETIRVSVGKLDSLMAEASELIVARMQGETHERLVADMRRLHARWRREWRSVRTAMVTG